jgi:hypothetical protein
MTKRIRFLICSLCLIAIVPVADAQRRSSQRDAGQFEGNWKGTLTMDVVYDVPAEQVERLSQPVELEIRIFGRGNAELYFTGDTEWQFREQRDFRITPVGEDNAVLLARISNTAGRWRTSFAFSFAKQGEDELLVNWSRMTIRNQVENDGLDNLAFAGTAVFQRIDD